MRNRRVRVQKIASRAAGQAFAAGEAAGRPQQTVAVASNSGGLQVPPEMRGPRLFKARVELPHETHQDLIDNDKGKMLADGTIIDRGKKPLWISPGLKVDSPVKEGPARFAFGNYTTFNAWGGTEVTFNHRIEKGELHGVRFVTLRFGITIGGTPGTDWIELTPCDTWLKEFKFIGNDGGDNQPIMSSYMIPQYMLNALYPHEIREDWAYEAGLNDKWWASYDRLHLDASTTIYYFNLVLKNSFIESTQQTDMTALRKDIVLRIVTPTSITSRTTGTPTLTLSSLEVFLEEEIPNLANPFISAAVSARSRDTQFGRFIDWIDISEASVTLNTGTDRYLTMGGLDNWRVACLLVGVRASSTTATSQGYINFLDLGPNALVDVQNPSGTTVWGKGEAKSIDYIKAIDMPLNMPSDIARYTNLYLLSWSPELIKALHGIMNGYRDFVTATDRLLIRPTTVTSAAEVHTLTCINAANDGGTYRLGFLGEFTQPLAFNTSAANMKIAFENLSSVVGYPGGVSVTFAGALTTTTTCTFSDSRRYALVEVSPDSLNDGGVAESVTVTRSTIGNRGWVNGTYHVGIWAAVFKDFYVNNGLITTINTQDVQLRGIGANVLAMQ
jgi:hypothetical protein